MFDITEQFESKIHVFKKHTLYVSLVLAMSARPVFSELPVPSANFVHAGDAAYLFNGANLTIKQNSDRAILNWQSFNVGSGNSVTFNQPDSSSVALNRIFQEDASKILGTINANGQIYLYNQNGFIFGKGVRFNANNIVATTLNVDETLFMKSSVLNAIENGQPAFFDTTGNNVGKIEIKEGAEINAETILMIAPRIVNQGVLNSADGQTILAASKDKVYLAASDKDSSLRGLLVEVGTGGTVTNAGSITADRGNVTLIGYAVNQNGRIRATTSVDKNGSIRLLGRDSATLFENSANNFNNNKESIGVEERPTAGFLAQAQRAGQVVLGEGSVTEVAVDSDTITKVPDAQKQLPSKVEIVGKQVWLQSNATIKAPSGEVKITATDSPNNPMGNTNRNDSYVYMDADSVIDVSGTDTAILPMERNSVAVEVRSNELADSPLQRDGVLRGKTVYVDLRKGTDIIDYSGAVATVEKSVAERLSSGGKIIIRSEGDVIQRDGALLDVSGGKVTYEDGFINESRLISEGQIFNISDADKLRHYDAILGETSKFHDRWAVTESFTSSSNISSGRFVGRFEEGKAAGSVNITAAATILSADGIRADTTIGPYQSEADLLPAAGELDINLSRFADSIQGVTFLAESVIDPVIDDIAKAPNATSLLRDSITTDLVLPDSYMKDSGLAKLTINTNNEVVIARSAVVESRPASEINLTGSTVTLQGQIINHAGTVNLAAVPVISGGRADLVVADDALIDVSGYWVNKTEFSASNSLDFPELVNGGAIKLSAQGDVTIGDGALLNASAGALLDTGLALSAGKGGDISLIANHKDGSALAINGRLESYSLTSGGTLHVEAASVLVSDDNNIAAQANQLILRPQVFESGGFSRYEIAANAGDLVIDAVLAPVMQNLVFNDSASTASTINESVLPLIASGAALRDITHVATRLDFERRPVDLDFTLQQTNTDAAYNLVVTERSVINVDPGAQLSLNSDTRIHLRGKINAPAADVSLAINTPITETGFLDDQAIWLADGSEINVASTVVFRNNDQGLRVGDVFDAGSVTLNANRGYVIIEKGARIDVSAKAETLDMLVKTATGDSQYQPFTIAPDAGQINILAAEGIVIDGELLANAASVEGARGGDFSLELNPNARNISLEQSNALGGSKRFDFGSRDIVIVDAVGNRLDESANFGDSIDDNLQGLAFVDVAKIKTSGFETVKLKTDHVLTSQTKAASEIRFESDVDLSVKNSVLLLAPTINSNNNEVRINAAYVALGSRSGLRNDIAAAPLAGDKVFSVDASLIDIVGGVSITKTSLLALNASDDIRFIGVRGSQALEQLTGRLVAATDINLSAGQIYPASNSQVSIDLVNNPDGVVTITGNGNASPVLSALGSVTINAPTIIQGGVIKAPLGNINLNATDNITLLADSVTSVSAEDQIIPFGETINAGGNWTYTISVPANIELADKAIDLNAPNIDMQKGSVVDISGGGDLVAYEFVGGPTGSTDVLLSDNSAGAFAILPESSNQYAPYDFLISDETANIGQQVYLEASDGLAAGYYTVLPARYALLPGAKLVTPIDSENAIFPGEAFTRVDGAAILAGKYTVANTDVVDSIYSAFVVEDGAIARTRSEYIETSANQFFEARLPADAGALVINTEDSLTLAGTIRGEHGEGANGSRLDILADNIEVIAAGSGASSNGFIQLTDSNLNELAVDSLMLGGKRRIGDDETTVSVQTDKLVISDNAQLVLPEILLVAKNQIDTRSGSLLNGTGASSTTSVNYVLDNDAAILGVSVNALPGISRTTSSGTGTDAGASIKLAENSTLAADNSIFVNSSNDVSLKAKFLLDGGSLSLGAKAVSLGTAPAGTLGLNLSNDLIASLQVDKLEVNSIESMTIFDDLNLSFNDLVINAPGINAQSASGADVSLSATGDIVLKQNGFVAQADGLGDGSLNINAQNIMLAGNDEAFVLDGFSRVRFTASQSVSGAGFGDNSDNTINNVFDFGVAALVVDTPLLTGEAGSSLVINSASSVNLINSPATEVDISQINNLGAAIVINARNIDVDTNVVAASGIVALNAQGGNNNDNVNLGSGAKIDVAGRTVNYVDGTQAGSGGGKVTLSSSSGDVNTAAGSLINLSGASVAGDSGKLVLSATAGTAVLAGEIKATHADGYDGAAIRVDLDRLTDFAAFIQQVQSSDFSRSQNYRIRNGDINIAALADGNSNIRASEIILTADNGGVKIDGRLDASGEQGGRVEVYASGDIDVAGAIIDAFATDNAKGGSVLLATTDGVLSVDSDTTINIAGNIDGTQFDSGSVTLRAPRTNANTDVAINRFDAAVTGAEHIDVEAVAVYTDPVIGNAQQATYSSDATNWLANKNTIASRLALAADNRVHYLAGVEVVNNGDITVTDAVDFYQWQQASADVIDEGNFTVRAANNLNINASISDAINREIFYSTSFGGVTFDGPIVPLIKNGASWNYRLVSGADLSSSNVLATVNDNVAATGNLTIAADVAIRTGTGDIDIASGGSLLLAEQTSVIYTVGQGNGSGVFGADIMDFTMLPDGPQFPDQGGDIRIDVAEDIVAALSDQFFTDWLQRTGGQLVSTGNGDVLPSMWAIVIDDFEQGIATLGGGDISIVAGGDISNLSVSTPTNGQIVQPDPAAPQALTTVIRGGGDINLVAGGDILSARILADGGDAVIRAVGDVTAANNGLNTLVAMGDASVNIEAGGNIAIEGVGNITMLPLSTLQTSNFITLQEGTNTAYFFSYSDRSSLSLLSNYGDITLNNDTESIKTAANNRFIGSSVFPWSVYPGNLAATTLSGNIAINNSFTLFPDADGSLALYSAGNIVSREAAAVRARVDINVSDVAIAVLPSILNPVNGVTNSNARLSPGTSDPSLLHDFNGPLHLNDDEPLHIVANGNITGNGELKIRSPKQAQVIAGGDIRDLGIEIQNILPTDKSIVMAGGDISYSLPDTGSLIVSKGISVTGPGSITVLAGGDINLGISSGIRSRGNIENFVLPKQGADIAVFAGIKNEGLNAELDTRAFIATYFKGESSADTNLIDIDIPAYQQQLVEYVLSDTYKGDLTQAVSDVTSQRYADNSEAIKAFNNLDETQKIDVAIASFAASGVSEQRKLILDVFVSELNLAAKTVAGTDDDSEYARGFLAINRLFPTPLSNETVLASTAALGETQRGDINLPFSRIQSTAGGDINIFAPHGKLIVGFTAEVNNASASDGSLGIVISGQGDLSAMTDGNIEVNLSRIQALNGGDISLWSSSGNIDAGRGAKTALTIPPPLTVVNKDTGQIEIIFPPAVSGSGINAGVSDDSLTPGKVTLAAPGGVVNASDGGIGSAGDLVVAATKVLGGDNFSAGGATVGVPVATNVTAGLSGLSSSTDNAVSSATDAAAAAAANAAGNDAGIALVTVELLTTDDEF